MSTKNIVAIVPVPDGVLVTFALHHGGTRTYFYEGAEAIEGILRGDDPKNWDGELVAETSG